MHLELPAAGPPEGCVAGKVQVSNLKQSWEPVRRDLEVRGPDHRWELPGNYSDFIGVMVFYLFCR